VIAISNRNGRPLAWIVGADLLPVDVREGVALNCSISSGVQR
jgi:hypothetical protein